MKRRSYFTGTVATDASWCPTTKISSFAVLIHLDHAMPVMKSGIINQKFNSSQHAEEWAIRKGVSEARQLGLSEITIHSDCLGAVNKLKHKIDSENSSVCLKHVKAHTNGIDIYSSMNRCCHKEAYKVLSSARRKPYIRDNNILVKRNKKRPVKINIWYPGQMLLN